MRTMIRASALVLVALIFVACGDKDPAPATAEQLEAARAETQEALDAVDDLEGRFEELRTDLQASKKDSDDIAKELKDTIDALRADLKTIRNSSSSAADSAAAAAAEVAEVVRRLTVLEDRFDYHLRRYHGGG